MTDTHDHDHADEPLCPLHAAEARAADDETPTPPMSTHTNASTDDDADDAQPTLTTDELVAILSVSTPFDAGDLTEMNGDQLAHVFATTLGDALGDELTPDADPDGDADPADAEATPTTDVAANCRRTDATPAATRPPPAPWPTGPSATTWTTRRLTSAAWTGTTPRP